MHTHADGSAHLRRNEILRLVREHRVASQEELQRLLRRRGFAVTQPTLSRDLKDLGLAKTADGYRAPADIPDPERAEAPSERAGEKLDHALKEFVLSVEIAGTVVVVRTPPAAAHAVALAIDQASLDGAVGTLAGDDTIFLATKSARDSAALRSRLLRPIRPTRRPRPARA